MEAQQDSDLEGKGARMKKFTEKGKEYDRQHLNELYDKLNNKSQVLIDKIHKGTDVVELRPKFADWMVMYECYLESHDNHLKRLESCDVEEFQEYFAVKNSVLQDFMTSTKFHIHEAEKVKTQDIQSNKSQRSHASSGTRSNISSKRLREEAKKLELIERFKSFQRKKDIELAKTKLKFEEEELELSTSIAVSEAKAKLFQMYENDTVNDDLASVGTETQADDVGCYINTKCDKNNDKPLQLSCNDETSVKAFHQPVAPNVTFLEPHHVIEKITDPEQLCNTSGLSKSGIVDNNSVVEKQAFDQSIMSDLTSFLLKKELLLSRLTKFDDRPEQYSVWKASFKSIMRELKVTDFEELDLLVKWLGPDSSRQAVSLRASNVNAPSRGLVLIWERLDDRYGCPELVESSLKAKLNKFPKLGNREYTKLYDLADILSEIECTKSDARYSQLLAYFDSSSGVSPIVSKLPYSLQEKWTSEAARYKLTHSVSFPPFTFFVDFIRRMSKIKNDPSFIYENTKSPTEQNVRRFNTPNSVLSRRTEVSDETDIAKRCPIHRADHALNACRVFKAKSYDERKKFLKEKRICFRCCGSTKHVSRDCKADVKCEHCNSSRHCTVMHASVANPGTSHGGEAVSPVDCIAPKCTTLCGNGFSGRSCGKVLLVEVYPSSQPQKAIRVYALIDDQSNSSLASKELFDTLNMSAEPTCYRLTSCSGTVTMYGRRANNITIRSVNSPTSIEVPVIFECNDIPNNTSEIPTPEVARCFPHLERIAEHIPAFDPQLNIQLLLGRDVSEIHHVQEQIIGPKHTPFAQKLPLGWVIIGNVCLNGMHSPDSIYVNKINITVDGRGTNYEPCQNSIILKEQLVHNIEPQVNKYAEEALFQKSSDDDTIGLSQEDRRFLDLMDKEFHKDSNGCWTAPLPFRANAQVMPNNRCLAWKRALMLDASLKKDCKKRDHFVTFMRKVLDSNAAEVAPPTNSSKCWYLPLFGVYHPKKPDQIRGVFDSSSVYEGVSLNNVLMSGPVLTNSLLGVLLRFRLNKVAVTADIEQMFYQFCVSEDHRDYLRFFWYENNDLSKPLIEYRMRVHVFGNSPSPAVATYGLRKAVANCEADVKHFVNHNFYVDDGLTSLPSDESAIDLLQRTQNALMSEGKIRLHKIASNSTNVMNAFPSDDLGKDLKDLCIGEDLLPLQRSLGLSWNLNSDQFIFNVNISSKPYTKRGLLSTVNSLYDPIGFIAPIVLSGKILLREATPPGTDWDEPLSSHHQSEWQEWLKSLQSLTNIVIPRMYVPLSLCDYDRYEILIFADASEKAVAAAAYMKVTDSSNNSSLCFIMGKSKLAPLKGHTIPRLELCAAVLATEIGAIVSEQLNIDRGAIQYFTDSKVVLGYIGNETRRFFTYVSNRVERIRKISSPSQWNFVPTHKNPADFGTRYSASISNINVSPWIAGPEWICRENEPATNFKPSFPLIEPQDDREIRPEITVHTTDVANCMTLDSGHIQNFSRWRSLVRTVSLLRHIAYSIKHPDGKCAGWHLCSTYKNPTQYKDAEIVLIKNAQRQCFSDDISRLSKGKAIHDNSPIIKLSPFLDREGVLRVGGRLNKIRGQDPELDVNPIILPKNHHITTLLIRYIHESTKHQGRHFTEGALRKAGYWAIAAKRAISSLIHRCVICRRLRRDVEHQKMADLLSDRITPGPPFTAVGVDMFGPWEVVARRTRGGVANSKRWAIMFTCLTSRAVHIEVVQDMSSSSFINALRRFIALRGPVKLFRSDRGTNFIGAVDDMKINAINVEDGPVRKFLYDSETTWMFNAPHSSHMGGVWERIIGLARRILDAILLDNKHKDIDHETLTTFMAEVCAILNSRPIAQISSDPESPLILSPSMLLTGKVNGQPVISEALNVNDIYRAQWKHARFLADIFWKRWRQDYLQCLQSRTKWNVRRSNVKVGDIVLLREQSVHRIYWPLGVILETFESNDEIVRKVKVRICKDGKPTVFVRPINEIVLLVE